MIIKPIVIDCYHGNTIASRPGSNEASGFAAFKAAGGIGVVHKATQGATVVDHAYANRRADATAAGLMWGAYHFNTGEDPAKQVANFFDAARPDESTLMALDFEDNPQSNMSIEQAREFLTIADAKLGRKLMIYGGNRIKELLPKKDLFFAAHRLWLCQYGPKPKLPTSWSEYWLWQYAADGVGPAPRKAAGFPGNPDVNTSERTPAQLVAEWPGAPA